MALRIHCHCYHPILNSKTAPSSFYLSSSFFVCTNSNASCFVTLRSLHPRRRRGISNAGGRISATLQPLDLTEDNVRQALEDARTEFGQIFDTSAGMTGEAELADLDGPFVKIRLRGRFWHQRSVVIARLANYLKQRIPEILEVDVEDEKQLDDSPENF